MLVSFSWGAVEFGVLGGAGLQEESYRVSSYIDYKSRSSFHGGGSAKVAWEPFVLPLKVGAEIGLIYQRTAFSYTSNDHDYEHNYEYIRNERFNYLDIPLDITTDMELSHSFSLGLSAGLSLIYPFSGKGWWFYIIDGHDTVPCGDHRYTHDSLSTSLGSHFKLDAGIRIISNLWLKPSISLMFDSKPTYPGNLGEDISVEKHTFFFSLGLALKI